MHGPISILQPAFLLHPQDHPTHVRNHSDGTTSSSEGEMSNSSASSADRMIPPELKLAAFEVRGNPFNRRRDVLKTTEPVTSVNQLQQIPTQLRNLDGCKSKDDRRNSPPASAIQDASHRNSIPSSPVSAAPKVSWAANVKDHSASTRTVMQKKPLPRLLPPDFIPDERDVVIELHDEGEQSESITSLRFEVMLHGSILKYIRASRQERGAIISRILAAVAAEQGRFVRYYNGSWFQVDEETARDFTANEMKAGARDVLKRIQFKRQAMKALLRARQAASTSPSSGAWSASSHKLQAKFKRPRHRVTAKQIPLSIREISQAANPLDILSKVATSMSDE